MVRDVRIVEFVKTVSIVEIINAIKPERRTGFILSALDRITVKKCDHSTGFSRFALPNTITTWKRIESREASTFSHAADHGSSHKVHSAGSPKLPLDNGTS